MTRIARVNGHYRVWRVRRGEALDVRNFADRADALLYAYQLEEIFGGSIAWGATARHPLPC